VRETVREIDARHAREHAAVTRDAALERLESNAAAAAADLLGPTGPPEPG
jgi:hypothetical protein